MAKSKTEMFPESDWLAELARLGQAETSDDGHLTTKEIAEHEGVSEYVARRRLGEAKRAGRLSTRDVVRENLNGRAVRIAAYRVVGAKS